MANIQSIITNGNGNVLIGTTTDAGFKLDVNGTGRFTSNLLAQKVQVGTASTINDVTGVGNTLQFANYSAGVFVTGSADSYIYKTSSVFGGLTAQTLIFQTRSDVAGGGFAFVGGSTPSVVAIISDTGAATFSSSVTAQSLITSYSLDGDPQLGLFTNASTGTSAEATIYVRNGTTSNDATFIQALGTGFTTTGGFVQDGGTIGTGTALSGGMSLMVRANADMRFYTNGHTNERMRITSGGNVVIGNTTAYGGLTVSDFSANDGNDSISLFYRGTAGNHESLIKFYDFRGQLNASLGNNLVNDGVGTQDARLVFSTSTGGSVTEKMRITGGGNVLIGTTTDVGAKLYVDGGIRASSSLTSGGLLEFTGAWSASPYNGSSWVRPPAGVGVFLVNNAISRWAGFKPNDDFVVNSDNLVVNSSTGNVLINTTTDSGYKLAVNGTSLLIGNVYTTGEQGIELSWSGNTLNDNRIGRIRPISTSSQNPYAGGLAFDYYKYDGAAYNWFEGMRLNGSGNVGIGTTNPSTTLDVLGKIKLGLDGSYGGSDYVTIGFGGTSNGYNRVFGYNGTSDGLYLASATGHGISFRTNGGSTDNMFIAANGNVGIGTTNPTAYMSGTYGLSVYRNDYPGVGWANSSSYWLWYMTGSTLRMWNSSAGDILTAHTTGNVLIGTSTDAGYKLDVNGNIRIGANTGSARLNVGGAANEWVADFQASTTSNQSYGLIIRAGTNSNDYPFYVLNAANNVFFFSIRGDGNVGIGTTSPQDKLEIKSGYLRMYDPSSSTGAGYSLHWSSDNGGSNVTYAAIDGLTTSAGVRTGDLRFLTSNAGGPTEKMRITSAGNVGIGTTSPQGLLQIGANSLFDNSDASNAFNLKQTSTTAATGIYLERSGERKGYYIYVGGSVDSLTFQRNHSGTKADVMSLTRDGDVGIGTTGPTEKLHVDGSTLITYNNSFQSTNSVGNKAILARVSPTSGIINYAEYATATNLNGFVIGSDDARVKGNITGDSLEFITNTSTRMTILSGGNVGINTTTPGSTLHVVGDVLIQTGALGVGVNPNATDGRIDASNDIVAFSTSDRRLKENITPIANALEKVRSLTGVEFDWKEETKSVHGYEGHDVGVIAQDVQAVLPEAVRTNDSGYLSVRYEKMIALLVEAMKEQQAQIDELKAQINDSPR